MNATEFEIELAQNRSAYEAQRDRIRSEFAGRYVALARGQLIAASGSYDEAFAVVQSLQPLPECYFIFPADEEPTFDVVTDFMGGWL